MYIHIFLDGTPYSPYNLEPNRLWELDISRGYISIGEVKCA
jgi:hypothetical protein